MHKLRNLKSTPELKLILKQHKFGFLSTLYSPMLPVWIAGARESGVTNIVVICDLHQDGGKSKKIFEERTGDAFKLSDKGKARIYTGGGDPIPFYFVESHNSETLIQLTEFLGIDCLFNAGTPRRISAEIISSMRNGVINIHPGLLPEQRGCTPVKWAIYNDKKAGNTAHFMDEGFDTGPIITSEWYEFPPDVDYQSIRTRVYKDGSILAGKVLASLQNSELKVSDATIQDNVNSTPKCNSTRSRGQAAIVSWLSRTDQSKRSTDELHAAYPRGTIPNLRIQESGT